MKKANFFKKACVLMMAVTLVGTSVNTSAIDVQAATKAKITLSKKKATMVTGQKLKLSVKSVKGLSSKKVKFKSSNAKVVKVSTKKAASQVTLTAKKAGKATITATSGKAKATCKITVNQGAKKVKLNTTKATIGFKKSMNLVATVTPAAASQKVTWKSSNKKIATVTKSGKVTTKKKAGKVKITATAKDGSKKKVTATITVKKNVKAVKSVALNSTAVAANVGDVVTLKATVKPANATFKGIYWTSSNKKVATVDQKGNVTTKAAGTVTITARANDGSKKKATATITVIEPSITLNKTATTLTVGATETLVATVKDAAGTAVTWGSSNAAIATVSNTGVVKAVAPGTAIVTAKSVSGYAAICTVTVKADGTVTTEPTNPTTPTEPSTEPSTDPTEPTQPAEPGDVVLDKTELKIKANDDPVQLTATIKEPVEAGADKTIVWSASGAQGAIVVENGLVSLDLSKIDPTVGTVSGIVTASRKDGKGKSATCAVEVTVNAKASVEKEGFYAYSFDKKAESYDVTVSDKSVSVSAASVAADLVTLAGIKWNNTTIKDNWNTVTVDKLVEKFALAQDFAFAADSVEIIDRTATTVSVKATYGSKTRIVDVERVDNYVSGDFVSTTLVATDRTSGRVAEVKDIIVTEDDLNYIVQATAVVGGQTAKMYVKVEKTGKFAWVDKVVGSLHETVAKIDTTGDSYDVEINSTYVNELAAEAGVTDILADMVVLNNYYPVVK